MAAPVNGVPLSIDYTSRDYYALRSDMIARMKTRLPEWSGEDPADFGVAMVEAFAYMGDIINYYIDRVANENYLATATQRQSIINLARIYGYNPTSYRAAYITVQLTNLSDTAIDVHAGTQLVAEVTLNDTVTQLIFTTLNDVTVLPNDSTEVSASNVEDISTRPENFDVDKSGELLGISNGLPDQQFTLMENQVVEGSVKIWINSGSGYEEWEYIQHLTDAGTTDKVFSLTLDANNYVCVSFGDSISGLIPPANSVIRAIYNVGGGTAGNLPSGTPFEVYQVFGSDYPNKDAIISSLTLSSSSAGVGGLDPEDNNTIRTNAPKALTAFNRAVTLKDFANISLSVPGVGKANAEADIWTSVNVYIAPQQNSDSPDVYPGYGDVPNIEANLTPSFLTMKQNVEDYLADKLQIGVTATILPPVYSPVVTVIQYSKKTGFTEQRVTAGIRAALASEYSYSNLYFAQVITPEEIESNLRFVEGVDAVKVQYLYRNEVGATPVRGLLVGAANEIFSFQDGDTSVVLLSDDASLSDLVSSTGALTPVFSSSFYNYNITSSASSITLTPSVVSGSTIYMNGVAVDSGVAQTVSTPVGQTTVVFSIIAADGITSKSYRVTITR